MHLVIMCARCGEPRIVRDTQSTYQCFKCGYRGRVAQAKVVHKTSNLKEAVAIVQKLKEKVAKGEVRVVYDASKTRGRRKFRGWFHKRHPESTRPEDFVDSDRYEVVS